jgi:hypothetical protein
MSMVLLAALILFWLIQLFAQPFTSPLFWLAIPCLLRVCYVLPHLVGLWRDTVCWFEWKEDVLRYRLTWRSEICTLPLWDIARVVPFYNNPRGFEILTRGGRLRVFYDRAGYACRLRDILTMRLRDDRLPGHSPPR